MPVICARGVPARQKPAAYIVAFWCDRCSVGPSVKCGAYFDEPRKRHAPEWKRLIAISKNRVQHPACTVPVIGEAGLKMALLS